MELGKPDPYVKDLHGKAAIHLAAAKLDKDTFEALIRTTGVDPMMPDSDGNTFLHIMALGMIKDTEYDFVRSMTNRHGLRLTRNNEGLTALNLIKSNAGQSASLRG